MNYIPVASTSGRVIATIALCLGVGFALRTRADELQPVDPGTVIYGNFYSMANVLGNNDEPPLPLNPHPELDLYLWSEGEGGGLPIYLYDDRSVESRDLQRFSQNAAEPFPDPGGGGGEDPGVPPGPPQDWDLLGLSILPPVLTSPDSLLLTATNTDAGAVFDLYYTTNLALLPSPALCRTNWAWLTRGAASQTVFGVTNLPQPQCYFRLGNGLIDTDGDGLSDAYEILVSHTNPLLADASGAQRDANNNGIPDWLEILMGYNPLQTNALGTEEWRLAITNLRLPRCWGHPG